MRITFSLTLLATLAASTPLTLTGDLQASTTGLTQIEASPFGADDFSLNIGAPAPLEMGQTDSEVGDTGLKQAMVFKALEDLLHAFDYSSASQNLLEYHKRSVLNAIENMRWNRHTFWIDTEKYTWDENEKKKVDDKINKETVSAQQAYEYAVEELTAIKSEFKSAQEFFIKRQTSKKGAKLERKKEIQHASWLYFLLADDAAWKKIVQGRSQKFAEEKQKDEK